MVITAKRQERLSTMFFNLAQAAFITGFATQVITTFDTVRSIESVGFGIILTYFGLLTSK